MAKGIKCEVYHRIKIDQGFYSFGYGQLGKKYSMIEMAYMQHEIVISSKDCDMWIM